MLCRADLFSPKTHLMCAWNLTEMASLKSTASLSLCGKRHGKSDSLVRALLGSAMVFALREDHQ